MPKYILIYLSYYLIPIKFCSWIHILFSIIDQNYFSSYWIQSKFLIVSFFPSAINAEKEKNQFLNGIENFDPTKLKHTETCEKNPLPTKDIIEQEKTA